MREEQICWFSSHVLASVLAIVIGISVSIVHADWDPGMHFALLDQYEKLYEHTDRDMAQLTGMPIEYLRRNDDVIEEVNRHAYIQAIFKVIEDYIRSEEKEYTPTENYRHGDGGKLVVLPEFKKEILFLQTLVSLERERHCLYMHWITSKQRAGKWIKIPLKYWRQFIAPGGRPPFPKHSLVAIDQKLDREAGCQSLPDYERLLCRQRQVFPPADGAICAPPQQRWFYSHPVHFREEFVTNTIDSRWRRRINRSQSMSQLKEQLVILRDLVPHAIVTPKVCFPIPSYQSMPGYLNLPNIEFRENGGGYDVVR